ncbi:MAG: Cell division protein FtsQ [Patescibacteria group bacterium]|nr:Cell division protein FtsQ [Patescibacteria group bacterium]
MNERRVRVPGGRQTYGRQQPTPRPGRRRAARRIGLGLIPRRLVLLILLLAAAGYGLWQAFAITTVSVKNTARREEIRQETLKLVGGSWRIGNLLTFNEEELVSKLQQDDPLLRSVTVKRRLFHTIEITAVMKQPSMGWSSGNQGFLLDRDGTAIGVFPPGSQLPLVVDGSNLPVQVGARVTSGRFVGFVTELVPALAAEGIGVRGFNVKETTLDLDVVTNRGYRLIFDTSRGVAEEMVDLRAVQKLLATQKKAPAEYVDLRVGGKAYYK